MTTAERDEALASLASSSHWTALKELWSHYANGHVDPADPQGWGKACHAAGRQAVLADTVKVVETAKDRVAKRRDRV
jgi:hypothetical protein